MVNLGGFSAAPRQNEPGVDPRRYGAAADVVAVARPAVTLRGPSELRSIGIEMDVTRAFHEVVALLDEDCFVATLEEMAHPFVARVEPPDIIAVHVAHPATQLSMRRGQQEVIVIGQ